jgi:hypothetical protein
MAELVVRKAPLAWWLGGLLLGLTQVLAVAVKKPLGVSTQFVVVESVALHGVAPEYAKGHKLVSDDKYRKLGYGWWLDVGLVAGALAAALASRRWKLRATTVWWRASHGSGVGARLLTGFVGGFLILMGARLAHGCTSGQFASGWAQLSLSVVPFTVTMFAFGMLAARLAYPKVPSIER